MKKSHRIARKGDTARTRAQAEETRAQAGPTPEQCAEIEEAFAKAGENAEVEWLGWVDLPEPVTSEDGRRWIAPPPFSPAPEGHRMFAVEIEDDTYASCSRLGKGDVVYVVEGLAPRADKLGFACPHQGTPFFVWAGEAGAPVQCLLDASPAGTIECAELRALWAVHSVVSFPNTPEKRAARLRQMEAETLATGSDRGEPARKKRVKPETPGAAKAPGVFAFTRRVRASIVGAWQ